MRRLSIATMVLLGSSASGALANSGYGYGGVSVSGNDCVQTQQQISCNGGSQVVTINGGAQTAPSYSAPTYNEPVYLDDYVEPVSSVSYGAPSVSYSEPSVSYGAPAIIEAAPVVETQVVHPAPVAVSEPVFTEVVATPVAAPAPVAVTAPARKSGWAPKVYVGVRGGAALGGNFSVNERGTRRNVIGTDKYGRPVYGPLQAYEIERDFDAGGGHAFGAEVGVSAGNGWRGKVEYLYIADELELGKGLGSVGSTTHAGFLTLEKSLGGYYGVRPYLNAGLGYADVSFDDDRAGGSSYAVKVGAGVEADLAHSVQGFAEYNYVLVPGIEAKDKSANYDIDYSTHLLSAGVRLKFK